MKQYNILILPSAYEDLKQARVWYRQHNAELHRRFTKELQGKLESIRSNPATFAVRYKEVRIANMSVFPYAIHYLVEEEQGKIIVLSVHHRAMSPEKWQERLK